MAKQGGRGGIYWAILIAEYNWGGDAMKEMLNARSSID